MACYLPQAVDILSRKAHFLAVNTQTNADNQGFNTISKYPHADYISLSERELRLEVRSRQRDIADIMREVATKLSCGTLLVTRGRQGSLCFSKKEGLMVSPSLTNRILDRVGAGDSVFAITSLCVATGAPIDVIGFIGNVVGAHAVGTVGHRTSIDAEKLVEDIVGLLESNKV